MLPPAWRCLLALLPLALGCGPAAAAAVIAGESGNAPQELQQERSGSSVALFRPLPLHSRGLKNHVPPGARFAFQTFTGIRLSGEGFVPFDRRLQEMMNRLVNETFTPVVGPLATRTLREGYPDPRAPDYALEPHPYVDIICEFYQLVDEATMSNDSAWQAAAQQQLRAFSNWALLFFQEGNWSFADHSARLQQYTGQQGYLRGTIASRALVVLQAALGLRLSTDAAGGSPSALQASAVAEALQAALTAADVGQVVEVVSRSTTAIQGMFGRSASDAGWDQPLLLLELSVYYCEEGARPPSPQCEEAAVASAVEQLNAAAAATQQLAVAGVAGLQVMQIRQRPLPQPPAPVNASAAAAAGTAAAAVAAWVPWHLDRIDQRSLPLDGQFAANASGTGVHVYIVSTGVHANHNEFRYADGRPGTRVKALWGYLGADPLQDCPDHQAHYGLGTAAASVVGGLTLGVARNVSIHSVRYRQGCLFEGAEAFAPGELPSAIDAVLTLLNKPAVLLIDTIWTPGAFTSDNDAQVASALRDRLDRVLAANVTVVAAAGSGLPSGEPCDNVIASHSGAISVASTDSRDGRTLYTSGNSSCIDIWAPGGGLGDGGITVAYPEGNDTYRTIVPVELGAAWLVAGVAAQFLGLHPQASPAQVKRALLEWSTPETVTMAGEASPRNLLFTNFTESAAASSVDGGGGGSSGGSSSGGGGGGLSTGAIVGIAVGAAAALAAVAALALLVVRRPRRVLEGGKDASQNAPHTSEWEILASELELRENIGEGSYGVVYRAIKGGVQVVAVKKLHRMERQLTEQFLMEIALMKFCSRDANIVQFYGAAIQPGSVMLVTELMEGGDLFCRLTADEAGELRWYKRGKGVALDIIRGLHFLHSSHVIHRDLKSKNILMSRDGRAKLADVGLAQLLRGQSYRNDGFRGTWSWAAPELLLGEEVSEKCDIYSLGVVLWEIVTHEMPIRGHLRPIEVPAEAPQEVADAIDACLLTDPTQRPSARGVYRLLLACEPLGDAHEGSLLLAASASQPSEGSGARSGPLGKVPRGSNGSGSNGGAAGAPGAAGAVAEASAQQPQHSWTHTLSSRLGSLPAAVSPAILGMVNQMKQRLKQVARRRSSSGRGRASAATAVAGQHSSWSSGKAKEAVEV